MTPEGRVKAHLKRRVKEHGGLLRFVKWLGVNGAPDTLAAFPNRPGAFIETKRPKGGVLTIRQQREHKTMRDHGMLVVVLTNEKEIDEWLEMWLTPRN